MVKTIPCHHMCGPDSCTAHFTCWTAHSHKLKCSTPHSTKKLNPKKHVTLHKPYTANVLSLQTRNLQTLTDLTLQALDPKFLKTRKAEPKNPYPLKYYTLKTLN